MMMNKVNDIVRTLYFFQKRQKILTEKTKSHLAKLETQKVSAQKANDNNKLESILNKEKKVRKYYKERKEELASLRHALYLAERERGLLMHHHSLTKTDKSKDQLEDDLSSSASISTKNGNLIPK